MPDTLDAAGEAKILAASKEAADLVASGLHPDDAMVKVARSFGLMPGQIETVSYAYNTGRQLEQMRSSRDTLDKFAEFPLADAAKVISTVYPKKGVVEKKAADSVVDSVYSRPPSFPVREQKRVKTASAPVEPVTPKLLSTRKIYGDLERSKRAYEEARRLKGAADDDVTKSVSKLANYFRDGRVKLAEAEAAAVHRFGRPAKTLFNAVAAWPFAARQKRASEELAVLTAPVDFSQPPLSLVAECFEKAAVASRRTGELAILKTGFDKSHAECFGPFGSGLSVVSTTQNRPTSGTVKSAFFGSPGLSIAAGNVAGQMIGEPVDTKAKLIEDAWLDLEDPAHQEELRKIKAHAMLNSFLTDPEDPISGYDPEQVVSAYNEISQLAPRVAEQPAAMRPLLQRRLQSNVQPFEAKEITDIEKGLVQSKNQTSGGSLLKDGPDTLLG